MKEIQQELFNPNDFNSAQLVIVLTNNATRTEIREGKCFIDGVPSKIKEDNSVKFIEFLERGLVIEAPSHTCAMGHQIMLDIQLIAPKGTESHHFHTTTKVKSVEIIEGNRQQIHLSLVQYDEKSWQKLRSFFEVRQNEIEDFFNLVKGN